jgi:hypothetical protein
MSDFLSQLADRALARSPMVRPRLQSIYESPAASALQNPVEEHLEVPAVPPRVFESARERRLPRGDEEPRPKQSSAEMDRKPVTTPEQKAGSQAPPEQPTVPKWDDPRPASLPEQIESAGTITAAEPETPQRQTVHQDERHLESVTRARAGQPVSPFEQEKTSFSDRSLENVLDAHATAKESTAPRIFSPETKASAKKPVSQPKAVTTQPAPRPLKAQTPPVFPLAPLAREGAPFAAAPSVHVTIGRVEVRAVLPPAPEPRAVPAPSSTRLSLDEYLKRNAGATR